jgi:acyl dehydratase
MVNFGGAWMIETGTTFDEKVFYINRALVKSYADASGDQNPIHQNEEFALSVGLPNVIAHGMLTMALAGKYLTDIAGGSANVLEFSARFTKPVIVPADIDIDLTVSATVTDVSGGRATISLAASSQGVKVLGLAKAVILV